MSDEAYTFDEILIRPGAYKFIPNPRFVLIVAGQDNLSENFGGIHERTRVHSQCCRVIALDTSNGKCIIFDDDCGFTIRGNKSYAPIHNMDYKIILCIKTEDN